MRAVIQRVSEAKVSVKGREISSIGSGLLIFVGIQKSDSEYDIQYIAKKIKNIRIFNDANSKMNLNIKQAGGEILSVPQFTLYADIRKGNRPGFDKVADPETAKKMWQQLNDTLRRESLSVKEGQFAACMQVQLNNNGPVTIWLDSKEG